MPASEIRLVLRPSASGEFTQFTLCGTLHTSAAVESTPFVTSMMAGSSGQPVLVVLRADTLEADWYDEWADALDRLPCGDLQVRFELQS